MSHVPIEDAPREALGLTTAEAAQRRTAFGRNELPEPPRESELHRLLRQFTSPIVLTLLAAAAIAALVGSMRADGSWLARYGDVTAILVVISLNAGLGWFQERRAEAAMASLRRLQAPRARVLRDGELSALPAADLVTGDVVEIEAGDVIPADGLLLSTARLAIDESTLTGESVPIEKSPASGEDEGDDAREHCVYSGTTVIRGKARVLVTAIGGATELGRIGGMIAGATREATPLEAKLRVFNRRILVACVAVSAILFGWGLVDGGRSFSAILLEAVSFAVAVIPEGLPAVMTITLALGVHRMAGRGAIVRRLPAVETLGAATTICTDKTGTLTCNQMTVRRIWAGADYEVTGEGYAPEGEIRRDHKVGGGSGESGENPDPRLRALIRCAVLCNDSGLTRGIL